ncbi:Alpha/beta-Hydrolases superfamily protein [Rhynchospora pubera]|uniref:protein-S-isoprenylcysteine alpha-carbonyl methylesterase n=1 Tax=Rhynchospora pubera TaxID=906938 RepID=A0AAV8H4E5_9POAL|nr:Alpha/beta-Hydrolases superfamily protein [Rhynchospora pubera]
MGVMVDTDTNTDTIPSTDSTQPNNRKMQIQLPTREAEEEKEKASSPSDVASSNSESEPLFPTNGGIRRRAPGESSLSGRVMSRRRSFGRDVQHAAEETFLLTRLTLILLRYLGIGYRWIMKFLALCLYAFLLMPGFIQVGYYYFFSSQVQRSVVYGEEPRNRLDLYLPLNANDRMPVVAFITGGAWIIGYKAWGALLGRRLAERGIIVACIDYRNFPQGTISEMVEDASQGISFVCNNIASFGGDPSRIYLIGQSAGAHIASCTLLNQAIKECSEGGTSWSVSQIKAYFGISGGYNIVNLVDHFHNRGLYRSIFLSIMEGEESLSAFSPELLVRKPSNKHAVSLLPRIVLFHGTSDSSIPSTASKDFSDALTANGGLVDLILYEEKTHTDLFLQDPLRGGSDQLLETLVAVIHEDDVSACAKDVEAPVARRLVPEWMLMLASRVSPF